MVRPVHAAADVAEGDGGGQGASIADALNEGSPLAVDDVALNVEERAFAIRVDGRRVAPEIFAVPFATSSMYDLKRSMSFFMKRPV
ncbi:hypothetical protein HBH75_109860 [Parastagonospora nodorum]|nr:hypothetical protein HBH75_109860 [Parastagonospora nodorum]